MTNYKKKLLAVFAHPDDESFGPGGTLALYAKRGVEIHILCATRGEAGKGTGEVRTQELLEAAKVLGVKSVEFLNFKDGELCNNNYHDLANKILEKIQSFKPDVVLTYDLKGISGHLDHIAVAFTTTFAFTKQKLAKKLYYFCGPVYKGPISKVMNFFRKKYFVYFPPSTSEEEITTTIDVSSVWKIKEGAMKKHVSQMEDVKRLLLIGKLLPKKEKFILFSPFVPRLCSGLRRDRDLFD